MGTVTAVPCLLCTTLARRWRDRKDPLHSGRVYRCAACGGRFAVAGDALAAIEQGQWDAADLQSAVRQRIAAGALPRIESDGGRSIVVAVGRQAT